MVKLKADMEAETAELSLTRAQLYIGSIERRRNTLEKDLSKAASDIKQVHGALNHTELDKLHAYNIDLQQKLQLVTNQLTRLSLPATISLPVSSTPNMSMIAGIQHNPQLASVAASSVHQVLPGAAALPPPGLGTTGGRAAGYYTGYVSKPWQFFS